MNRTVEEAAPDALPAGQRSGDLFSRGPEWRPPAPEAPAASRAFLGVDPGLGGGLALVEPDGTFVACWDTPTIESGTESRRDYDRPGCWALVRGAVALYPGLVVVLEQLGPMPKNGCVSAFKLGGGLELWATMAVGVGVPLERVRPQRWQRSLAVASGEKASLQRARELFPAADLRLVKHSGRAAALLIAEFGRRTLGAGTS